MWATILWRARTPPSPLPFTETRRSREEAETLGTLVLERQLEALLGEGELLSRQVNSQVEGDTLLVTLSAECREQIGREVTFAGQVGEIIPGTQER